MNLQWDGGCGASLTQEDTQEDTQENRKKRSFFRAA